MIGKPDENLGRKATGPVKWQPVDEMMCAVCETVLFYVIVAKPIDVELRIKAIHKLVEYN